MRLICGGKTKRPGPFFMKLQRRHAQKNILMAENHERGAVTKTTIYYCFVLIKKNYMNK